MAPSMALLFLMFTVTNGGRSLLAEKAQGTLARLLISPTTGAQALLGKLFGAYLTGVLQMLILILTGSLLFGLRWATRWACWCSSWPRCSARWAGACSSPRWRRRRARFPPSARLSCSPSASWAAACADQHHAIVVPMAQQGHAQRLGAGWLSPPWAWAAPWPIWASLLGAGDGPRPGRRGHRPVQPPLAAASLR
ncbi:MAG: ABC transporter permease [Anaerolineae bacterium]|nr:ABC transporter permease [Anaerolineae bacterium]